MHWSVKEANAIIDLHCFKLSGRLVELWGRRPEERRLTPFSQV